MGLLSLLVLECFYEKGFYYNQVMEPLFQVCMIDFAVGRILLIERVDSDFEPWLALHIFDD